jgi:hypothetical protein
VLPVRNRPELACEVAVIPCPNDEFKVGYLGDRPPFGQRIKVFAHRRFGTETSSKEMRMDSNWALAAGWLGGNLIVVELS